MTKSTMRSLGAAIAAQELAVADADQRLMQRLHAVTQRARAGRSPLRSWGITAGSLAAAWLFLRSRRGLGGGATRGAVAGDRVSILLNAAMPMLVPVIGMRAAALLTALAAVPARTALVPSPAVAPHVDLGRYCGTWYEIARLPTRYERRCAGDVTATYLIDRSRLRVINRCRRAHGGFEAVRGSARVVDRVTQAKLKVSFAPPLLRWLPAAWADYWILEVAPDYSAALVGTPDRRSLWVLARTPYMSPQQYQGLLALASAQGYDTQRVIRTAHSAPH